MEEPKTTTGLPRNTVAAFAYLGAFVTGLIFLLVEKDPFVRFHAMQSLIVFGGLSIIWAIPFVGWILSPLIMIIGFVLWVLLIVKAYQGEEFALPIIGDFVKKQLGRVK